MMSFFPAGTFAIVLASLIELAPACTTVIVPTPEGNVIGRTMELGIPRVKGELEKIYLHPRGANLSTLQGSLPPSTYGYLAVQFHVPGTNISNIMGTSEGMNEAGLTVSMQTHRAAIYETANSSKAVAIGDLSVAAYLLGSCATVDEAATALDAVNVLPTPILGHRPIGCVHFSVQDASGASRVFEYIDGGLKVYDNTEVGVLTNDPSYEWHLGNLDQYTAYPSAADSAPTFSMPATSRGPFTSYAVQPTAAGKVTVPSFTGHGLHSKFLPGGYTPADRFVKMFLLKQLSTHNTPPHSLDAGIVLATGLLDTIHIPRGAVSGSGGLLETTNWACIKMPQTTPTAGPTFFFRTYDNMQWKKIELGRVDLTGKIKTHFEPIPVYEPGMGVRDATPV